MKPREKFILALERKPISGRVPHFGLVFYLTMETLGKVHPRHRDYTQWHQMSESERTLHRNDIADLYIATAERYEHSAILLHRTPDDDDEAMRLVEIVREKTGDTYFLMLKGDATYAIPSGGDMAKWCYWLYDHLDEAKVEAQRMVDEALKRAERCAKHGGIDGLALCEDYCFNRGPFLSPDMFAEVVTPYLGKAIKGYRELGLYAIKHTDGNIMPILDQLVETNPHALHSLDPQAGIDIAEIKNRIGDRIALIGNVNCGLLQSGTDEQCIESARYALRHGMPNGGYIFSTSNCVYTGMPLARYELVLDVWRKEGVYEG